MISASTAVFITILLDMRSSIWFFSLHTLIRRWRSDLNDSECPNENLVYSRFPSCYQRILTKSQGAQASPCIEHSTIPKNGKKLGLLSEGRMTEWSSRLSTKHWNITLDIDWIYIYIYTYIYTYIYIYIYIVTSGTSINCFGCHTLEK